MCYIMDFICDCEIENYKSIDWSFVSYFFFVLEVIKINLFFDILF